MTGPNFDPPKLLQALATLRSEQRADVVCAAGPPAVVVAALADEVEKLTMTQVAQGVEMSEWLVALADEVGEPAARGVARRARAQALAYAGRFEEALPHCEQAVALADQQGAAFDAARARLASVHSLAHLARYAEATTTAEEARAAFTALGESVWAARADISLGGVHQKNNDPAAALHCFDRARPLLAGEPLLRAQLDSNRGLALLSRDDFTAAEAAYRAALAVFEEHGQAWAAAIVENNLAELATRQGRLHAALHHFERTRRHLDRDAAPAELARVMVEQADALVVLGAFQPALRQYRKTLPVLRRHGQVREALRARAGTARTLAAMGQEAAARRELTPVIEEYAQLGQADECARLDLLRAELAYQGGRYDEALVAARHALAILTALPAQRCIAQYHVGRAAVALGDLSSAQQVLTDALDAARELDIPPLLADLLHVRGRLTRARGDVPTARGDFRAAVAQVERLRGNLQAERFRAAFHGQRLAVYTDLVVAALEQSDADSLAEAFATVEQAKGRALLDQIHAAGVGPAAPTGEPAEAALASELEQLRGELNVLYSRLADASFGGAGGAPPHAWAPRARAREQRIAALEDRLLAVRGNVARSGRPLTLPEVQARLVPGTALVEYFAAEDELLAFVVRSGDARVLRRLGSWAAVAAGVDRLHFQLRRALRPGALLGPRGERLCDDARRELGTLHQSLIAPLAAALDGTERLLIVPHGALHAAPFAALWDGMQHLIERFELTTLPSASLLARPRDPRRGAAALVVGAADERAPQIADEARRVAESLETPQLIMGPEATAARVQAAAPDARLIHFACHGHFSPHDPLGSGLKLADRWLNVREICDLRLRAGLVTLSGCETGRNVVTAGDELQGLSRAFLAAGAAALLVSLWTVQDEAALKLMTDFYK
jgi:CHAT domain-containing protein/tetratricopeptide (TPR) repeat protein